MTDTAYAQALQHGHRLEHHYGPRVHLLSDPYTLTLLAHLSSPDVHPPRFHELLELAYRRLLDAACEQLPVVHGTHPTRMSEAHGGVGYDGPVLDPGGQVVVVDIARGGIVPSYVIQRQLLALLDPEAVRVDHVYMQRVSDAEGHVVGVQTAGSKIGGPVAGRTVLFPDPMAATGRSMDDAVTLYSRLDGGKPARMVALHLIVTPEYLARMTSKHPEVEIYALRLDRGLSSDEVLATTPGTHWDEEVGLNDHSYIVPGAGGLGELINNAFV